MARPSDGERCSVSPLSATARSERPNTNGTLMAFSVDTFPTSSPFLPSERPRWQKLPLRRKPARKKHSQRQPRSRPRSESLVTARNEPSGLCGTRAGPNERVYRREDVIAAERKSVIINMPLLFPVAAHLRTGLLSLRGLNDAGRTSGSLEGLGVLERAGTTRISTTVWRDYRGCRRQTDCGSWFHPLRQKT